MTKNAYGQGMSGSQGEREQALDYGLAENHIVAGQCFYCTKHAPTIRFRDYDGTHEICSDCFRVWAETVTDADDNGDTEWRNYREGVYAAITRTIRRSHEDPL